MYLNVITTDVNACIRDNKAKCIIHNPQLTHQTSMFNVQLNELQQSNVTTSTVSFSRTLSMNCNLSNVQHLVQVKPKLLKNATTQSNYNPAFGSWRQTWQTQTKTSSISTNYIPINKHSTQPSLNIVVQTVQTQHWTL